jgi:hypothetical protein
VLERTERNLKQILRNIHTLWILGKSILAEAATVPATGR